MHMNWKFVIAFMFIVFEDCRKFSNSCHLNETHAIILAREGSKAIKYKNLLQLNGISLLGRSINTIKSSGLFANIWVSTDGERIAAEALKFGASVYQRGKLYAQDNATSVNALKEFLREHHYIQRFALFQCTSVFLKVHYIREAVNKFQISLCVFAVVRCDVIEIDANDAIEIDTMDNVKLAQCLLNLNK